MDARTMRRALIVATLAITSFSAARAVAAGSVGASNLAVQEPTRLVQGNGFACAITAGAEVQCAGAAASLGQRGDGSTTASPTPTTVSDLSGVVSIAAGASHACALLGDGTVACWGENDHGEIDPTLALSQLTTPVVVAGVSGARGIATTTDATCALIDDGTVSCWGLRLHDYAVDNLSPGDASNPEQVPGLTNVVQIVAGQMHVCARRADGGVVCWGNDLGLDPGTVGLGAQRPFELHNLPEADKIFAGGDVVCAVDRSGDAHCGGRLSALFASELPDLSAFANVADISISTTQLCLTDAAGHLRCWGDNFVGSLGGLGSDSVSPVSPRGVDQVVQTASGFVATCALTRLREIWCWGAGSAVSTDGDVSTPAPVRRPLGTVVDVAMSDTNGACALLQDGTADCWGSNAFPVGSGAYALSDAFSGFPMPLEFDGITGVALSSFEGCAIRSTGPMRCWSGGSTIDVDDSTGARHVSYRGDIVCFVTAGRGVRCSGSNEDGILGIPPDATSISLPASNPVGITDVVKVAVGLESACALRLDGTVACWGANDYLTLGVADPNDAYVPVSVPGVVDAVDLVGGPAEMCAVDRAGVVTCWGSGLTDTMAAPHVVSGLTNPAELALGDDLCGRSGAGMVTCLEANPGVTDAIAIAAGLAASCAVRISGEVVCWKTDDDGDRASVGRPVQLPGRLTGFATLAIPQPPAPPPPPPTTTTPPTTTPPPPTTPPGPATPVTPLRPLGAPGRLVDTRPGGTTADQRLQGIGRLPAGGILVVPVAGRAGTAEDTTAVSLNVTAAAAEADGYLTVYPCRSEADRPPQSSNVNFRAATVVPNAVLSKVTGGLLCIYTSASTHLLVDVAAYFGPNAGISALAAPARILESRPGASPTVDGRSSNGGRLGAGEQFALDVAGRAGIGADATTAILNVTAIDALADGYLTVWPCRAPRPEASSVNFHVGQVVPNLVVARLDADGRVCIFSSAPVDLAVDVSAAFEGTAVYVPLASPTRYVETRAAAPPTFDGGGHGAGRLPAGSVTRFRLAGRGDVPANAAAVAMNVAAVDPIGAGYLTVYPCRAEPPNVSNLNVRQRDARDTGSGTMANAVISTVDAAGDVCVFTSVDADVIVDVTGWFTAA